MRNEYEFPLPPVWPILVHIFAIYMARLMAANILGLSKSGEPEGRAEARREVKQISRRAEAAQRLMREPGVSRRSTAPFHMQ